jgi:hypothetical protein
MRFLFIVFSLLALSFSLQAQTGAYYLSHYTPPDDQIDFRSVDIVQDEQGEIYFATKGGVLEFDGRNWRFVSVTGAVYGLSTIGTQVYQAGLAGIGKLGPKNETPRLYLNIAEGNFFSSITLEQNVFFCAKDQISIYDISRNELTTSIKPDSSQGSFLGIYNVNNTIYVRTAKRGLLKIENPKLVPSDITPGNLIFSTPSANGKRFLVGMDNHQVYIHENNTFKEIIIKDQALLNRNVLVDGVWVNDNLIALGTLRGGVLFVNPTTGVTEQLINYQNGLPDNEVYSLMTDKREGVWVAHEYGFTRIAPNIPFRSFDHYPGLTGNLLCAQTFQGKIYVGTTLGLYQLVEDVPEPVVPKTSRPESKRRKRSDVPKVIEVKEDTAKSTIDYKFLKVAGIDGKISQLVDVMGKLFASGLSGVYEVSGLESKLILLEPVRSLFFSPSLQQLIIGTYAGKVKTLDQEINGWRNTNLIDSLNDFISHSFEDRLENMWLCGRKNIYKVEILDGSITDLISYPISNPSRDETVGLAYGSEIYVAASGQFSRFDSKTNSFVKYDSLPGPRKYFASAGYFWFHDGAKWRTVDTKLQSLKMDWLGLFPNLRYLAPNNLGDGLWVITANNELYKFTNTSNESDPTNYPLFLRAVKGEEISIEKRMEILQNDGLITFEFVQPEFIGLNATQFRYQIKGKNINWSSWSSSNNVISLSPLTPGNYELLVQSRDLLGNESNAEQIKFVVLPPYWQRWWFYALEVFVFSFFVTVSLRLARANTRYRYISQILSLITVVMLIQFLETVISSLFGSRTSPVIDFAIQVVVALMVFPVEYFARDAMSKYSQGKYRIRRIWDKEK